MTTKKEQANKGEQEDPSRKKARQAGGSESSEESTTAKRGVKGSDPLDKKRSQARMPGTSSSRDSHAEEEGDDEEMLDEDGDDTSWEKLAEDPEVLSRILESLGGVVPGIFKRVAVSGVGNLLLSEDGLRTLLSENKKLPKEAVGLLVNQADVMRREVLRIISKEIRIFLENVDFGGEIAKILTSVSFEIKTEIRFIPNDQAVKPKIKNKVKAKRQRGEEEGEEQEEVEGREDSGEETPHSEAPHAEEARSASHKEDGMQRGAANLVRKIARGMRQRREDHEASEAEHDEDER